jgi:hypothetical protein
MATVFEGCTTEEKRFVARFWAKGFNAKNIHNCAGKSGERFADDEEVETEARKWLSQQSRNFYAAGFGAPVKRWDKCSNVGGAYVEKYIFPPVFYILYPCHRSSAILRFVK